MARPSSFFSLIDLNTKFGHMKRSSESDRDRPARNERMQQQADAQQNLIAPSKPRQRRVWWQRILWSLGWSLALGTPVLWIVGVLGYAGVLGYVEIFGVPVENLRGLLLLSITGPLAVAVLWALFVLPAQLLWWATRWMILMVRARRRRSGSPGP